MSAAEVVSRSGWPASDEAMYVAIVRAWCQLTSRSERREHPLGQYVLGPGFIASVARTPVDGTVVASVCAKLASRHPWEPGSGEPMPLPWKPFAPFDPLSTWWRALDDPEGLGVHYDELAGGTLEFLSVGRWEEPPPRQEPARE